MNSQIKMRCWNTTYKEMNGDAYAKLILYKESIGENILDCKVIRFTEIIDINGIEVYESDKVKGRYMVQRSLDPNAEPEIIYFEGVVKYAEGCFYVKGSKGQCVFSFNYTDYELEVVGNEFEGVA